MSRWTTEQDAYLAIHFDSDTWPELLTGTSRTKDAIYSRAKVLGLKRGNRGRIGQNGRFLVGTPFRPGTNPPRTAVRDTIIRELVMHFEQTCKQLQATSGAGHSAVWKALSRLKAQNKIHVSRWDAVVGSPGNWEAVYRVGPGANAVRPARGNCKPVEVDTCDYKPDPIPRPQLGPWGVVW